VLDLDNFKYVNDALGHHAGDELILAVAALLQRRLRESDIIARLGGDEFAVLLPHGSAPEAELVAADLVGAIRGLASAGDGADWSMTTSVGVAPFQRGSATREAMLVAADVAMYDAKQRGRDRIATASPAQARAPRSNGLRARAARSPVLDGDR
jgi:diguanylate cyclase (GGDEF)-like protein